MPPGRVSGKKGGATRGRFRGSEFRFFLFTAVLVRFAAILAKGSVQCAQRVEARKKTESSKDPIAFRSELLGTLISEYDSQ